MTRLRKVVAVVATATALAGWYASPAQAHTAPDPTSNRILQEDDPGWDCAYWGDMICGDQAPATRWPSSDRRFW